MCFSILLLFGEVGKKMYDIIKELLLLPSRITRRIEYIGHFIETESNGCIKDAK